jgi:hypothetical protein
MNVANSSGQSLFLEQDILQAWGVRREEDSSTTYDQQRVTNIASPASEDTVPSGV